MASFLPCTLWQCRPRRNGDLGWRLQRCEQHHVPWAPGTGAGNDNNCNGVIDPDEEEPQFCAEDVNQDGSVSVADVLAILSEFGCVGAGCEYDVDDDNAVTVRMSLRSSRFSVILSMTRRCRFMLSDIT